MTENGSVFDENMRIYTGIQRRDVIVYGALWRAFMKRCIFGDVFSGYVRTVGQTGEKILRAQTKSLNIY